MHQPNSTRPAVTVEPIVTESCDISHCRITVGSRSFDALFTQASSDLKEMILDATDVRLTTEEIMTVTRASRRQMEREADRLKAVLQNHPAGTVAQVDGGMFFWLSAKGDLLWEQWMTLDGDPAEFTPGYITCIGEIDTEELHEVAQGIRSWLANPRTDRADLQWLRRAEEFLNRSGTA